MPETIILDDLTKKSLRVLGTLQILQGNSSDFLAAIVPLIEPIFPNKEGSIFDTEQFSQTVHNAYGWDFSKDVVEQLIPHLVKKG